MNYKLTIQYDGGRYKGWQRLGDDANTIQGKLEGVLTQLAEQPVEMIGCSRTDAGVHALCQVANVKLDKPMLPLTLQEYLNRYLPGDISVVGVEWADDRFHARYQAKEKTYLFKIWNMPYPHPFMRKYSQHVPQPLDVERMRAAARHFIGEQDFTAFSNAKSKKKTTVRSIYAVDIEATEGFINIRVRGDGFLHNMVRRMVWALMTVGLGQTEAAGIPGILASKERINAGGMADACGLYLESITYP